MVSLLNVKRQTAGIRAELDAAIARVLDHAQFILGPEVRELEEKIAAYCGTRHAVGCASGSDAVMLPFLALGLQPGDTVVTVPFTFFATAGSLSHLRLQPRFVDIDPHTFNMDPAQLEKAIRGAKAILPVHLFGQCADMDAINGIAARHHVPVIEDAAQAIGAEYKGRRAGSLGWCGAFSFFPSKNLGACGDGGMITTDDERLAEKLRMLRVHGTRVRYYHELAGVNSRLDTLQAAILLVKLRHLEQWTERRRANAARYRELLHDADVALPAAETGESRHIYNQFTIRVKNRDAVKKRLADAGIGSEIYYPVPLHLQERYADLGYKPGDFPESERACAEVLSLPIEEGLSEGDIEAVAGAVREAVGQDTGRTASSRGIGPAKGVL
ncbi:MAG: DegT/DnrJ/EryC1/StrS family aminotransferase [Acidobacteriota bacterium]|nr:DegT/DnrJ/EryC1/StrS family aminotransferase [Acidobacteriota bacterium]